jgi:prepilin-type N-terminal cleavage/methylation domain-containing protein
MNETKANLNTSHNKHGFTLAELLVVVAIIGILVAVSVPIFTSQLKKSRLATNQAQMPEVLYPQQWLSIWIRE